MRYPEWVDELPQSSQGAGVFSGSHPKTPSKRSHVATPSTSNFSPSKVITKTSHNRSDPIEDVDNVVDLVSDEEISQFWRKPSLDEPPAKKYRFHQTEEMSGHNATPESSSQSKYLPVSPTKTPPQKTSQWQAIRDDPVSCSVYHACFSDITNQINRRIRFTFTPHL